MILIMYLKGGGEHKQDVSVPRESVESMQFANSSRRYHADDSTNHGPVTVGVYLPDKCSPEVQLMSMLEQHCKRFIFPECNMAIPDAGRVRELMRVADWLQAKYGSVIVPSPSQA